MTQGDPEDTGRPTVRDKRRIDPQTYELREPETTPAEPAAPSQQTEGADTGTPADAAAGPGEAAGSAELEEAKRQLADRTSDLQRVQAEYVNYKRRVDRDRDLSRRAGVEQVLTELMPVLDGLQTAREHEELTGGFKAFADEVTKIATKHGLESFGEAGDPFDPRIHEALMHAQAEGLTGPTCVTILQPGYRIGDRILRPARVAVAEPDEGSAAPAADAEQGTVDHDGADQGAGNQTGDQGAAGSQQ